AACHGLARHRFARHRCRRRWRSGRSDRFQQRTRFANDSAGGKNRGSGRRAPPLRRTRNRAADRAAPRSGRTVAQFHAFAGRAAGRRFPRYRDRPAGLRLFRIQRWRASHHAEAGALRRRSRPHAGPRNAAGGRAVAGRRACPATSGGVPRSDLG
ncbi:hypothetical protein OY671_010491, partial [Metschnikowia pulcherrima]